MKKENENIHRLLDGDVPAAEKDAIIRQVQDDPVLRKEFDDLSNAVELLEREGRMHPPLAFTASVMRKLPRPADPFPARLRRFLFGGRVLRWNMAAALAVALLTVVTALLMMTQLTHITRNAASPDFPSGEPAAMVRLTFVAPDARNVAVAGDFNKWRTDSHVMTRENGTWTINLPLKPGMYTYMFIVDGEHWITDPSAESYRDDGFGYQNAVMRVSL
jgi:hypothetical protein